MGLLGDGRNGSTIDAVAFMDSGVPERIGKLVSMGLLVAIGSTRDRGAISIQLTHDGESEREYFRQTDEAVDWLSHATAVLLARGIGVTEQDPPVVQKPTRGRSRAR